jgi:CheY-like chemotaxis protein
MDLKNIKVLLVADDKFLVGMYSLKFSNKGLNVDSAIGPIEALKKLRGGTIYDILLFDVIMPGMDGIELLKTVRDEKLSPNATVIMLTNQGQPADIERAKALGIQGYIVKASTIPSEVLEEVLKIHTAKMEAVKA